MQRIIRAADLVATPWKNSGGLTREIASHDAGGALHWRLSIADVDKDGPFSAFPGLSRILTVIEGHGMDLHTPTETLAARPLQPLAFAGDVPVQGALRDGPVRNFNLIYDANHVTPTVTVLNASQQLPDGPLALHCLTGKARVDDSLLSTGDTMLAHGGVLSLTKQTQIICITL